MRYRLTPMTEGRVKRSAETDERRSRIIDAAMNRFSQHGYRATHVEDIAHEVGVAKGTVFLDFGSKEGLFLAAYQHAVQMLPAWLDAPEEVVRGGFWDTLDWWLQSTEESVGSDPVPNRLAMIGGTTRSSVSAARSTGSCGARTPTAPWSSSSSGSGMVRSATTWIPR